MASKVRHPLEPLDHAEVQQAIQLLRSYGKVTPTTRFISVSLKEPRKELVNGSTSRQNIPREALVVLFDNGKNACYEAALSLTKSELVSFKHVPGAQLSC